jgi:predicted RND superfamily exporter protein
MQYLISIYERLILGRPKLTVAVMFGIACFFAYFAMDFKLDASGDSLLLERDADLRYYHGIRARYGSDDFLIITYTTENDLFSPESIADIAKLRDELSEIEGLK